MAGTQGFAPMSRVFDAKLAEKLKNEQNVIIKENRWLSMPLRFW